MKIDSNFQNINEDNVNEILIDPDVIEDPIDREIDNTLVEFINTQDKSRYYYITFFLKFSKYFTQKFFPVSMVLLIYMMINVTNIIFVSHSQISNKELPYVVNLGLSLYLMLGISVSFGLNSSLDTFCTNAYGAKLYYLMGCYLNRALIIVSLAFIPIAILMFFFENILLASGQEEIVAEQVGQFINGMLPGMIFFFWTDAMRRFIQAQGVFIPSIFVVLITSLIHPLWIYLFFNVFLMGPFGIGLACSVTNIINFGLMLFLLKKFGKKESIFLINRDSFKGWKEFFAVALPSMLLMCLESWNYQIVNFLVGFLKNTTEQNVNAYIISFSGILWMFPFGLSVASSNVIGRLVGDFATKKTEIATKVIIVFCLILSIFVTIILLILKNIVPYIYTYKKDELELMQEVLWLYSIYLIFEILTDSYSGIYRGLGMQKIIAFANFIAYYIISLPLTYLLTFTLNWRIHGVWISYSISILVLVFLYGIIHYKNVDYYIICKDANKRMSRDSLIISTCRDSSENNLDSSMDSRFIYDNRKESDYKPIETKL